MDERKPGLGDIPKIAELFERCVQLQEQLAIAEAKMARIEALDVSLEAARAQGRREMSVSAAALLVKMAGAWEARGGDLAAVGDVLREAAVSIRAISAPATTGAPQAYRCKLAGPDHACNEDCAWTLSDGATTVGEGPRECACADPESVGPHEMGCPLRPPFYEPDAPPSPPKGGEPLVGTGPMTAAGEALLSLATPERPRPESAEAKVCRHCGGMRHMPMSGDDCPRCGGTGEAK